MHKIFPLSYHPLTDASALTKIESVMSPILYWLLQLRLYLDTIYFAENWKHYNKIIFKYVNSAMRPIFNKNFVKKKVYGYREQCTGLTGKHWNVLFNEKKNAKTQMQCVSVVPKRVLSVCLDVD